MERSDQIETDVRQLRSFIGKKERPEVGGLAAEAKPEGKLAEPQRLPPDPNVITPSVENDSTPAGARKKRAKQPAGRAARAKGATIDRGTRQRAR